MRFGLMFDVLQEQKYIEFLKLKGCHSKREIKMVSLPSYKAQIH